MFKALLPALLLAAAPAWAQSSLCAALPETGPVGTPAPDRVVAPVPNPDRTLGCPDDFTLHALARPPRCTAPGVTAAEGNPRAACYAALPLGPLAPLPPRRRPTRSCAAPVATTVLRLAGANIGWRDATISFFPADGITATTLTDSGDSVDPAESPVVQGCFAWSCRLVKLEITAAAAPVVELRIGFPGKDPVGEPLTLRSECRVLSRDDR